jgi:SPX domain protein involved in polyphosphate accumulation
MAFQAIFERYETKYLLSQEQYLAVRSVMDSHMTPDAYGRSTICNLYFDTPDFLLIRRSLEKPVYKEKLRLRSYGVATPDSTTFLELKKKYKKVVYKRRISLPYETAMAYVCEGKEIPDSQIRRELDYCKSFYKTLQPAVFLSYEREAFYEEGNSDFRVTFDRNILWRQESLTLCDGVYGEPILQPDQVLMELKSAGAIPLWMVHCLSQNKIYQTSFSKYGTVYRQILARSQGGAHYA